MGNGIILCFTALSIHHAVLVVGNYKEHIWISLQWHNFHTKFHKNLSSHSQAPCIWEIGKDHGQQYHHTGSLFQLQIFNIRHGSITNCVKPKSTSLVWSPMAHPSHKISLKSIQPFLSCYMQTDRQTKEGTLHG
jgi:hypothetical protein